MLAAKKDQAGKSLGSGHVNIQQYQIGIVVRFHRFLHGGERIGLENGDARHRLGNRLLQGRPKERVIIGDYDFLGQLHLYFPLPAVLPRDIG